MKQETRSIPFTRLYHALNGEEVRSIIMRQLKEALDRDTRFKVSNTFPKISWEITVAITAQPREEPHLFVQVEAGAVEIDKKTGEPVLGPHDEFKFRISTGQEYSDIPDDVRAKNGLDSPIAVRAEGLPISEGDADRRVVEIPEDGDAVEAVARLRVDNSPLADRLAAAHVGRPHKVVETSPLAEEANRKNLGIEVSNTGPVAPRKTIESTHPGDPRMHRTVEGVPTGLNPTDPRHKLAPEASMDQVATVGRPKTEEPQVAPQTSPQTIEADPREEEAINYAASVEITQGSEHEARAAELKARSEGRREAGEDMTVKLAPDSAETRGKDDIPEAPAGAPDPASRGE